MRLNALTLTFAAALVGCGAGSELDDYEDGVPDIVPSPIPSTGGEGSVGAACGGDASCDGDGTECLNDVSLGVSINFPGGYCTQSCQSAAQCPSGSSCFALGMTCLKTCTTDTECRKAEGYTCAAPALSGTQKFCLPQSVAGLIGGLGGTTGGFIGGAGGTTGGFLGGLFGGGNTGGLIGGGNTGGLLGGGTTGGTTSGGFIAGLFGGGGTPGGTGSGDAMGR